MGTWRMGTDLFLWLTWQRSNASPQERAAFLADACHCNEALRTRVQELLDTHERAQDLLRAPSEPVIEIPDRNKPVPPAV